MPGGEVVRIDTAALSAALIRRAMLRGELARRAGLSAATVSAAFAGRALSLRSARQIASALGMKLAALIQAGPTKRAAS